MSRLDRLALLAIALTLAFLGGSGIVLASAPTPSATWTEFGAVAASLTCHGRILSVALADGKDERPLAYWDAYDPAGDDDHMHSFWASEAAAKQSLESGCK